MSTRECTPETAPPVVVLMGVSGSGKSTIAGIIAGTLGWELQEGDALHPPANLAKMASGQPLTDEDRWPWLERVAQWVQEHTDKGLPGIITCSALRRSYRDLLRGDHVVFVHLVGTREQIAERLTTRLDHFMPASLLDTQIAALEPPDPDEDAIVVGIGDPPSQLAAEIIAQLEPRLRSHGGRAETG
ncbi:gluconokinase [Rhodococcus spongiicola]|uniref:Gluconokinase n=1 Tax=Rhodococcus spongiicola TaxID=2487352 RepID=A0A3S3CSR7_9NOCA|nr:gluconokinase [Rhodococcus spongiicola]RVW04748.1 gluconokinase [Rhodococcus spongiicola]